MTEITLPGRPIPWSRPRHRTRHGSPQATKQLADLTWAIKAAMKPGQRINGPVMVEMAFQFGGQAGGSTWIRVTEAAGDNLHTKRPDVDNCTKLVMEACQHSGLLADDSQVAILVARKTEVKHGEGG